MTFDIAHWSTIIQLFILLNVVILNLWVDLICDILGNEDYKAKPDYYEKNTFVSKRWVAIAINYIFYISSVIQLKNCVHIVKAIWKKSLWTYTRLSHKSPTLHSFTASFTVNLSGAKMYCFGWACSLLFLSTVSSLLLVSSKTNHLYEQLSIQFGFRVGQCHPSPLFWTHPSKIPG